MAEAADFHFSSSLFDDDSDLDPPDSISYWPHDGNFSSDLDSDLADHFDDAMDEEDRSTSLNDFGSDSDSVAELFDLISQDGEVNPGSQSFPLETLAVTPNSNSNSIVDEDDAFRFENHELGLGLSEIDDEDENEELGLGLGLGLGGIDDGCMNESDSEEEEDGMAGFVLDDDDQEPYRWDSLLFNHNTQDSDDFYEWEDVAGRDHDREVPDVDDSEVLDVDMEFEERLPPLDSMAAVLGEDGPMIDIDLDSVNIEETGDEEEEFVGSLEWHVLFQASNFELYDPDEFGVPVEYDTLLAQFPVNHNAGGGSPPAAKLVVENLPTIILIEDDVSNNCAMCAVCKDEISTQEHAKVLPCSHYYHGECILPWLDMHNTCPVCRYELPTDDPDYERRRALRASHSS